MTSLPFSNQLLNWLPQAPALLSVFKLFLLPAGGGIPAGVLRARASGMAWPVTTLLYLASDIVLAIAFEPVLRLVALVCGRISCLARVGAAMGAATARTVSHFGGTGAGPVGLVMIAFGVDPMTGRASALAAGHGFMAGWGVAIAGDMLYFAVVAVTTLRLDSCIKDPDATMWIILCAMFCLPPLARFIRSRRPFFPFPRG